MRTADNGFVKFMCKLDGKKPPRSLKWGVSGIKGVCPTGIRDALGGNRHALMNCFSWRSTPQGVRYWDYRHDGTEQMTEEDYEFLREVLRVYE